MRKTGHFFLAFVPLILTIAIQNLVVFFGMGLSSLVEGTWYTFAAPTDFYEVMTDLTYFWTGNPFNTSIMIVYAVANTTVFGLWYYMRYEGSGVSDLRRTFHPMTVLGIILLMPGTQYLTSYLISFVSMIFPHWLEQYMELMESAGMDASMTIGMFCYSVILAPVSEELIFRGVTLRQARRALPFWAANILQAALFGVFHMNIIQGIYAFFLGLILGYVCQRGGSICHAVLLHFLFNFWAAVISEYVTMGDSVFAFFFWFFLGVALTVCGLLLFRSGAIRKFAQTASSCSDTPQGVG